MGMRSLQRLTSPLLQCAQPHRHNSTFRELYRNSVSNAIVRPGDPVVGQVVGQQSGKSNTKQRFFVVDFGLKNEAPFASKEIPGASTIGAQVALPLISLENPFNEPALDYSRRSALPSMTAERLELWTKLRSDRANLVHGRFATIKRGGAAVKALGVDAFAPRHHVVAFSRPLLGTFAPFYVLSIAVPRPRGSGGGASSGSDMTLDVQPVVSSYGGYLFTLAKLVGCDKAWRESGGGTSRERLAYLRLLTRLLATKNVTVRRMLPRSVDMQNASGGQHSTMGRPRNRNYRQGGRGGMRIDQRSGAWLDGMQTVDGKQQRVVQLGRKKTVPKAK